MKMTVTYDAVASKRKTARKKIAEIRAYITATGLARRTAHGDPEAEEQWDAALAEIQAWRDYCGGHPYARS